MQIADNHTHNNPSITTTTTNIASNNTQKRTHRRFPSSKLRIFVEKGMPTKLIEGLDTALQQSFPAIKEVVTCCIDPSTYRYAYDEEREQYEADLILECVEAMTPRTGIHKVTL
eukprot:TRINITY_DN3281_c0_g1_i1.p1 TRINITY_DN3281_c0_g1~~TRINITY_DN3281_c0_g1_i1.p1  ORF type:complete len:114 (+),score=22.55 TRINITY_DN3281_c0_g1_i1:442-783(+)